MKSLNFCFKKYECTRQWSCEEAIFAVQISNDSLQVCWVCGWQLLALSSSSLQVLRFSGYIATACPCWQPWATVKDWARGVSPGNRKEGRTQEPHRNRLMPKGRSESNPSIANQEDSRSNNSLAIFLPILAKAVYRTWISTKIGCDGCVMS